jgi:hypothetical protein
MDFVNNILNKKVGEREHSQFVRFGRGKYDGRAALNLWRTEKIKLGGSFEYAVDFVLLAAELNAKFSGIIMSKEDFFKGKKKAGLFVAEVSDIEASKIQEIKDKVYCMLLDATGNGLQLKMKKKLPKPGKSGDLKIDDKFCQLEADMKFWQQIKEYFNLPEAKKVKIKHSFIIEDIILPKGETSPELMRMNARRKGKIERISDIDGQEARQSYDFEA